MWPRGDAMNTGPASDMNTRRSRTTGLSGFVAFMKRKDAEDALRELDGFDWGGSILRVGWSKAVPVAAKPLYGTCLLCSTLISLTYCLSNESREEVAFRLLVSFEVAQPLTSTARQGSRSRSWSAPGSVIF